MFYVILTLYLFYNFSNTVHLWNEPMCINILQIIFDSLYSTLYILQHS